MCDLYNDNCLNVLKNIPDASVNLVVTDPPYRVTSRGSAGTMGGFWKNKISNAGKIFENNDIDVSEYFPELFRVLCDKSVAYVMTNNINLRDMLNEGEKVGFRFIKSLIWKKNNKICGRYYMNCFEYILMFRKGSYQGINNGGTPDILDVPIKKLKREDGTNYHDTEKPVELMKILIENSSNVGDIVLDPFMGIGATGVACTELNRKFIGCEIDDKYFTVAKSRICGESLKETKTQLDLFDLI